MPGNLFNSMRSRLTRARSGSSAILRAREGRVLARFAPGTKPAALEARIEAALAASS